MKIVKIRAYRFDELDSRAQDKAIEHFWNINVYEDWWDFAFDRFREIAETLGVSVNTKKTYFNGFYCQGQGSSFTASVDVGKLIAGIKQASWKNLVGEEEHFQLPGLGLDRRVLDLVSRRIIEAWASVKPSGRETSISIETNFNYEYGNCANYNRIDRELEKLEDFVTETCEALNHFLFTMLRDEYDGLTSREMIIESIQANDYQFTKEGERRVYL